MYFGLHVKFILFLSDINETWISSTDSVKIHRVLTLPPGVNPIAVDRYI